MILRRLGEGFGEGKGTGSRLGGASADDGKRFARYELRGTFHDMSERSEAFDRMHPRSEVDISNPSGS